MPFWPHKIFRFSGSIPNRAGFCRNHDENSGGIHLHAIHRRSMVSSNEKKRGKRRMNEEIENDSAKNDISLDVVAFFRFSILLAQKMYSQRTMNSPTPLIFLSFTLI